ncbi:MAG: hypothetical protein QXI10_02185 [Candidatus Diapherotrites archaeon]
MNFSSDDLVFALKYPFSELGKKIILSSKISLDDVPEKPLKRAESLVNLAISGANYEPQVRKDRDSLLVEILAFPLSKVLVAVVDKFEVKRKYLQFLSDYFFSSLSEADDKELFGLALELKINFLPADKGSLQNFFAVVSLVDFLRVEHSNVESKLVNQVLVNGFVYFSKRGFARLVSDIAVSEVESSLAKPSKVDVKILDSAKLIRDAFSKSFVSFESVAFGPVKSEAFPPCMAKIYNDLLSGSNVSHMARFSLATFLNSIGMPVEKIVDAFRKAPNFNEKITRYQVERISNSKISGKSYSCPACDKMRSYGLCVANCPVRSPLEFYRLESKK